MKRNPLRVLKSLVLALPLVAATAHAQTTSAGPYYANPAWTQTLTCSALANCPRFIVLSNMNSKAVLDRETGLVWLRETFDIGGGVGGTWDSSNYSCQGSSFGAGRLGWRLPSLPELTSLLTTVGVGPAGLPPGHPFVLPATQYQSYWTSTDDIIAPGSGRKMFVYFPLGTIGADQRTETRGAWCVRG